MPSRPGIAISSSNRSGDNASVRLIAESPSLAVPTSCAPSARASNSCRRSAASGSSSAINTLSVLASAIGLDRHRQRYLVAAAGHRAEAAAGAAAEARFQPLADVGEADAGPFVGRGGQLVLAAMLEAIADLEHHPVVVEVTRLDPDHHRLAALRHAIFDRILHDRLEQ